MKKLVIVVILFLVGCNSNHELLGIWYESLDSCSSDGPMIIKFEKDSIIEIPSQSRVQPYQWSKGKIIVESANGERQLTYTIKNDVLEIFDQEGKYPIYQLKRKRGNSLVNDCLNDSTINLELPQGIGRKYKIDRNFKLDAPIYLYFKDAKLMARLMDETVEVDENFDTHLLRAYGIENGYIGDIQIVADKNLKQSDIEKVYEDLIEINRRQVFLILKHDVYEEVKALAIMLPHPIFVDLDTDSEIKKETVAHSIKVQLGNSNLIVNGEPMEFTSFFRFYRKQLETNELTSVLYFIDEDVRYQEYIRLLDGIYNQIQELREGYIEEKYNISYKESELKNVEAFKEAKKKYPFRLGNGVRLGYKN